MDRAGFASSQAVNDWTPGDGSATDRAWLADWRRRIATLYAEVRGMATADPAIALAHWRAVREQLYREHPQSPIPVDARGEFRAQHFEHDPALRFEVAIESAPPAAPGALAIDLPNSGAETLAFTRLGRILIPFPDGPRPLSVFWMAGYAGGLFIPFRDATNGNETYGAGRYLVDAAKSADLGGDPAAGPGDERAGPGDEGAGPGDPGATAGTLTIDFNFATQPSCAFDPRFACPLAPPENRLDREIRAGERLT